MFSSAEALNEGWEVRLGLLCVCWKGCSSWSVAGKQEEVVGWIDF